MITHPAHVIGIVMSKGGGLPAGVLRHSLRAIEFWNPSEKVSVLCFIADSWLSLCDEKKNQCKRGLRRRPEKRAEVRRASSQSEVTFCKVFSFLIVQLWN
jgi:hypothetical protein